MGMGKLVLWRISGFFGQQVSIQEKYKYTAASYMLYPPAMNGWGNTAAAISPGLKAWANKKSPIPGKE
jgi:hypothetical protein